MKIETRCPISGPRVCNTVQTDLSLTQHAYLGYAFVANQRFWESMAAPDRALVSEALREALYFGNQIADTQNDKGPGGAA